MDNYVLSSDGSRIHYQYTLVKPTALVFVHGWLGNAKWWDEQRKHFENNYMVVQVDLPGHGASDSSRTVWSSAQYVADIKAVVESVGAEKIILVGHSMSGAYVLEASLLLPQVIAVILVDTLKNMDQLMTHEQAEALLFTHYRKDFTSAVEHILPEFLFTKTTPVSFRQQLIHEFLQNDPGFAVRSLEPLYKMDIRAIARLVRVPVRAINSDYTPTNAGNNRKYFGDYAYSEIAGTGHYPMLERPGDFNTILDEVLQSLSI